MGVADGEASEGGKGETTRRASHGTQREQPTKKRARWKECVRHNVPQERKGEWRAGGRREGRGGPSGDESDKGRTAERGEVTHSELEGMG